MRVPGQKFLVPANKKPIAGMARSYKFKYPLPQNPFTNLRNRRQ